MKKLNTFAFAAALFAAPLMAQDAPAAAPETTASTEATPVESAAPVAETTKAATRSVVAVGDMMIGLNYPDGRPLPEQDGALTFSEVKEVLQDADVTFGNLEGVLLDKGGNAKACGSSKNCWTFRSPERYINHFLDAGFDLLSVANNHSSDFGKPGRENTYNVLKKSGIGFAGFENSCEYTIIEKNGVRYGMAAFSVTKTTLLIFDEAKAKEVIGKLRDSSDVVIVSMHIGGEGKDYTHVTRKNESFLGANRGNPYKFARMAIDAGADLVFGSGPHVPRAVDLYKGKFIAYSLGNFSTATNFNIAGMNGYAPIVKVIIDEKGDFVEGKLFSNIQKGRDGSRRPYKDTTGACIKHIKKLTEEDIPEAEIEVLLDGTIRKK